MPSLKSYILTRYGAGVHSSVSSLKRLRLRLAKTKNKVTFLKRCLSNNVIPKCLKNRCPIKTKNACRLTEKYRENVLRESFLSEKRHLRELTEKINKKVHSIKNSVNDEDFQKFLSVTNKTYEKTFLKTRSELKRRFEHLLNIKQQQLQQQQDLQQQQQQNRPSTIGEPVLQLLPEKLPPEAVAVLKKGPKFA